jgi:hypothetical protein
VFLVARLAPLVPTAAMISSITGKNFYDELIVLTLLSSIVSPPAGFVGYWIDRRFSKPVTSSDPVWWRITQVVSVIVLLLIFTFAVVIALLAFRYIPPV